MKGPFGSSGIVPEGQEDNSEKIFTTGNDGTVQISDLDLGTNQTVPIVYPSVSEGDFWSRNSETGVTYPIYNDVVVIKGDAQTYDEQFKVVGKMYTTAGYMLGDGDTLIYEPVDDVLKFQVGGVDALLINHADDFSIQGYQVDGFYLSNQAPDSSNPTYAFVSDKDTGMYRYAVNSLAFAIGGSDGFRILSSGALEIPTAPDSGDDDLPYLVIDTSTGRVYKHAAHVHANSAVLELLDDSGGLLEYNSAIVFDSNDYYTSSEVDDLLDAINTALSGKVDVGTTYTLNDLTDKDYNDLDNLPDLTSLHTHSNKDTLDVIPDYTGATEGDIMERHSGGIRWIPKSDFAFWSRDAGGGFLYPTTTTDTVHIDQMDEYTIDAGVMIELVVIKDGLVDGVDVPSHASRHITAGEDLISVFDGSNPGLAPTAGGDYGDSNYYLDASGSWSIPDLYSYRYLDADFGVTAEAGSGDTIHFTSSDTDLLIITIGSDPDTVSFEIDLGEIDHTQIANIGTNTHAQIDTHLADSAIHYDHTTISISGGTSLTGGGAITANRTITLVNDSASPGNSKYYGTNSGGTKGYFDLTYSAHTIRDHTDVESGFPLDDEIMVWNDAAGEWQFEAKPSSGSGNAYAFIVVGATTMSASGSDTFEIESANSRLVISAASGSPDTVTFTLTESNIVHDNLSGAGTNTHAQIDTHIANNDIHYDHTSIQVQGGYSITNSGNDTIDDDIILTLVNDTASPGNSKYYGTNGAGVRGWQSQGFIDHTQIANIGTNTHAQIDTHIANNDIHYDHTSITIATPGNSGLSGGGTIDSSRTLSIDLSNLTAGSVINDSDYFVMEQSSVQKRVTWALIKDQLGSSVTMSELTGGTGIADFTYDGTGSATVAINSSVPTINSGGGTDRIVIFSGSNTIKGISGFEYKTAFGGYLLTPNIIISSISGVSKVLYINPTGFVGGETGFTYNEGTNVLTVPTIYATNVRVTAIAGTDRGIYVDGDGDLTTSDKFQFKSNILGSYDHGFYAKNPDYSEDYAYFYYDKQQNETDAGIRYRKGTQNAIFFMHYDTGDAEPQFEWSTSGSSYMRLDKYGLTVTGRITASTYLDATTYVVAGSYIQATTYLKSGSLSGSGNRNIVADANGKIIIDPDNPNNRFLALDDVDESTYTGHDGYYVRVSGSGLVFDAGTSATIWQTGGTTGRIAFWYNNYKVQGSSNLTYSSGQLTIEKDGGVAVNIIQQSLDSNTGGLLINHTNTSTGSYPLSIFTDYTVFYVNGAGQSWTYGSSFADEFTTQSDPRLKKHFEPLMGKKGLDMTMQMKPYIHEWRNPNRKGKYLGFRTDEVEQVFSTLVSKSDGEYSYLAYGKVTVMHTAAIQELYRKIQTLEEKLKQYENGISS